MKNIVVYTLAIMLGTGTLLSGQKLSLELLPVQNEIIHPEAVIDTSYSTDSLIRYYIPERQELKKESELSTESEVNTNQSISEWWESRFRIQLDFIFNGFAKRVAFKSIGFRHTLYLFHRNIT